MPRLRCSCPCNRYTPKLQGIQELEDAGFRLVRCQCQHCGGGGRWGCHHLVPPRIHHRTRGLCWLCVGLDHPHVAGLLDDAEETDESPHDPTSFGLDSSIPGSRPSIISQAAPLASSWDWRAELGLSHAPPLASVPAPALPQQAESPPAAAPPAVPADQSPAASPDLQGSTPLYVPGPLSAPIGIDIARAEAAGPIAWPGTFFGGASTAGAASGSDLPSAPPPLRSGLIVNTIRDVEALSSGYLSAPLDATLQIIYVGDPEKAEEKDWVYAECVSSGCRGWLPLHALPPALQPNFPLVQPWALRTPPGPKAAQP